MNDRTQSHRVRSSLVSHQADWTRLLETDRTLSLSVRWSTVSIHARPDVSSHTGPDATSVRSTILSNTVFLNYTGRVRCGDRTRPVTEFVAKYQTCPVTIPDTSNHSITSATNSFSTLSSSPLLKCANHQVYLLVHMC